MGASSHQNSRPRTAPQRVLGAAKRVEGVGNDAGAVLGPRVVRSKSLVVSSGALPLV